MQYKRVREDEPGSAPALSAYGLHQIQEGLPTACPKASSTHGTHPPTHHIGPERPGNPGGLTTSPWVV